MEEFKYKADEFTKPETLSTQLIGGDETVSILSMKNPKWKGWCMAVPKRQVTYFDELQPEEFVRIVEVVRGLHMLHKNRDGYIGFDFFINRGSRAGQHVPHVHAHFIPRYENEDMQPFEALANAPVLDLATYVDWYAKEIQENDVLHHEMQGGAVGEMQTRVLPNTGLEEATFYSIKGKQDIGDYTSEEVVSIFNAIVVSESAKSERDNYLGYYVGFSHRNAEVGECANAFVCISRFSNEETSPLKAYSSCVYNR